MVEDISKGAALCKTEVFFTKATPRAGCLAEIVRKVTNATPRAGYLADKEVFSSKGPIFHFDTL